MKESWQLAVLLLFSSGSYHTYVFNSSVESWQFFSLAGQSWKLVAVSLILLDGGILAAGSSTLILPHRQGNLISNSSSLALESVYLTLPLWHWNPGSWQLYLWFFLLGTGILAAGSCISSSSSLLLESWQLAAAPLIFLPEVGSWQLADVSLNLRFSQENPDSDSFISNSFMGIVAAGRCICKSLIFPGESRQWQLYL
jgi:hypothetical protein